MKQIELVEKINGFGRGTIIDQISLIVSSFYFLVPLYLIGNIVILLYEKERRWFITAAMALSLVIHLFFNELLIKGIFSKYFYKERPFLVDSNIQTIGRRFTDSTFPSGHMSAATAVLTVLIWNYPKLWPFALLFIVILGFSRVHNGFHYLLDVVSGLVFGVAYGLIAILIAQKIPFLLNK